MGKIISIVGNLGAGKTTLMKLLCEKGSFVSYWENPDEHPFQADFCKEMDRWALTNQMDFFLFRCSQEMIARQSDEIAIMDGGVDQDFRVFTKNLYNHGHLLQSEFEICERYYNFARTILPQPDLFIRIMIDIPTLLLRRSSRKRKTVDQSFVISELTNIEELLDEWLSCKTNSPVIPFVFGDDIRNYAGEIDELLGRISDILFDRGPRIIRYYC